MAGTAVKPSTTSNASRSRKRVEAAILKRGRDGSAFTLCDGCNKNVPVVLIDLHSCSLDSKIRMSLESQVVEKTVEIKEKKRKASSAGNGKGAKKSKGEGGAKKGKRPQSAFFLFMSDFRLEFKVSHPDEKGVAAVGKAGGEKWRSMTDEVKKPYFDKAEELKAELNNGKCSGENNVADEEADEVKEEEEQEVEQPSKPLEEDDEKNELDDDI